MPVVIGNVVQAKEEDLTPEYREERDRLKNRLSSDLVPKEKNGQWFITLCIP